MKKSTKSDKKILKENEKLKKENEVLSQLIYTKTNEIIDNYKERIDLLEKQVEDDFENLDLLKQIEFIIDKYRTEGKLPEAFLDEVDAKYNKWKNK